jgi:type IV secretion system protein VirB1
MAAIVNVESSYNPYAIGVVKGRLQRQPKNKQEAIVTAKALAASGWNFSMGIAQINRYNLPKYNITYEQAFEPCANLWAGSKILEDCYVRAANNKRTPQQALQAAISCYYSGNFTRGFRPDIKGKPSYVEKVLAGAGNPIKPIPVVPTIETNTPHTLKAKTPGIEEKNEPMQESPQANTERPTKEEPPVKLKKGIEQEGEGATNPTIVF